MSGKDGDPDSMKGPDEETTDLVGSVRSLMSVRRDRATLTLLSGRDAGRVQPVEANELIIGRGSGATLRIDDKGLSRRHVRIFLRGGDHFIEDLSSKNGTWLDDDCLANPRKLSSGARIYLGHATVLRFDVHDAREQQAVKQLYESAIRDPLTHLYNRRYFDERSRTEVAYAARHGTALSLVLFDIDHFKQVNDSLGHIAGDAVLRVAGQALSRLARTEDVVVRYGGEEFCILARGIDREGARVLAERVRRSLASTVIPWEEGSIRITVSGGVASTGPDCATVDLLLRAADEALYRAKRGGRNRVEL